ncbi:MAG: hypothetical protein QW838_04235 [Candidatus Nitrosotenuis sp.]
MPSGLTQLAQAKALSDLFNPPSGQSGFTFEEQKELDRMNYQASMQRLQAQLRNDLAIAQLDRQTTLDELRANISSAAREVALSTITGSITAIFDSLREAGFTAPGILGRMLSMAASPRGVGMEELISALRRGEVIPTQERLELFAQAAQRPSDIIRLLFLAGGQTPPAGPNLSAFNVGAVFAQGRRARQQIARQLANAPRLSLNELAQQLTPPIPQARAGAQIVQGPALFTVGDRTSRRGPFDRTEFAWLAPGSVIAPKFKREPSDRATALRALTELVLFGRRVPPAERRALQGSAPLPGAQLGGLVQERDLPMRALLSTIAGARAAGMALRRPERGVMERMADLRMLVAGSLGGRDAPAARMRILRQLPPELRNIFLTARAEDPTSAALDQIRRLQHLFTQQALGNLRRWFSASGMTFEEAVPDLNERLRLLNEARMALAREAGRPHLFPRGQAEALGLIARERTAQRQAGLRESLRRGAPGTDIPFAEIEALPAPAQEAIFSTLAALTGDVNLIESLRELAERSRSQAFSALSSRLVPAR